MDSDSTATISEGGAQAEQSKAIEALDNQPDWPARFRMFARRSAAGLVDLLIMSALSLFFLGLPLAASMAFSIWEQSANHAPTLLSHLIEHGLQFAGAIAIFNQLYFYTALAESGHAQASLGKILVGIKTTDIRGNRQTFGGVFRRLNLQYALFLMLCAAAYFSVNFAAEFIPSLQMEQLRMIMRALIVAASFALCLVTDREQNLYDKLGGRLVVLDDTGSAKERLQHFASELGSVLATLNPVILLNGVKKYKADTGDSKGIVAVLLVLWTYISSATGAVLLVLVCQIGLAMTEVERGIAAQSKLQVDLAAQHFKKALALSPGIAVVYQYNYMLNDNLDLAKQDAACARLFAIRGNAQDYLARARIRAKQKAYKAAEGDYKKALSGRHGELGPEETDTAATELALLKIEEEAASIPDSPAQPMHTAPTDIVAPDSGQKEFE